jgi:hypothetical protein
MTLHLWHMLMGEAERVGPPACVGSPLFKLRDHRFAATGITGHGIDGQRPVARDDPGTDQGLDQREETRGIAAGIGYPLCAAQMVPPAFEDFGEAERPAGCRPVRGGGINHAGPVIVDQADRLDRGVIGEAEDDDIGVVQHLAPGSGILPTRLIDFEDREFRAPRQPLPYFKAGCAVATINENARHSTILLRATIPVPSFFRFTRAIT